VVERNRKLQIPAFVWAFVFGFAAGEGRTLADFRRCYNSTANKTLSPGGFCQRLTPTLAEYFSDTAGVDVGRFRDVMIADETILRLHELFSEEYKARHEKQAGAKLHLLHDATEKTIERFDITHEKTHESSLFKTGLWLQGRLILFDLAYFQVPPICADRRE